MIGWEYVVLIEVEFEEARTQCELVKRVATDVVGGRFKEAVDV